jgi:hypothetical protein
MIPSMERAEPREAFVRAKRSLDESRLPRSHWHFYWEDEPSHWYVETVNDGGVEEPVKQIVVERTGTAHRYWWRHIDDDFGGLGDQGVDPDFPGLEPITAETFLDLWNAPE